MVRRLVALTLLTWAVVSCGDSTVQPTVSFDNQGCRSSDVNRWPSGPPDIEVSNDLETRAAVVMGTYADGFGHDDLVAYGTDTDPRPDFMEALEIFQVAPESTSSLLFDHGPGVYFMVCMPDNNTMVVLNDVIIEE